jgi:uncharacterized membrane protein YdjX (TVP38/TMEM64 family)
MLNKKPVKFTLQALPFLILTVSILSVIISKDSFSVESLLAYAPENFMLAALFILFLYFTKSLSVLLPISVVYVLTGIVFPLVPALLLNTAGTLIVISIGYFIGYFSLSAYAEKMAKKYPKLKNIVEKQQKNGWFASYFLRVCPISCDLVSIYLGSVKLPLNKYYIAGIIGSVPGIVSATLLGASIDNPFSPECILSFSLIIVLSTASYIIYKTVQKKQLTL